MSFGFSVGDFIAVVELANKLRKEFAGAPSQFKDISNEVRSLSIVLQDVDVALSEEGLSDQQIADVREILSSCYKILSELEKTISNYSGLESSGGNLSNRVKRVWKKLKWEPEDVRDFRNRIISNITLLNTLLAQIASQATFATKKGVDRLNQRHDDQDRLAVLSWLTPIEYASQQSDFFSRRQPGTGEWLLDSREYQAWIKTSKQTLFCPGIPGAGKTILTSIVIDDLIGRFRSDANTGIAYIYCNFRQRDEQKADSLLASLLKQLAERLPSLPETVKNLYNNREQLSRPPPDEVSKALQSVAAMYSTVFIVVDAVDECQNSDGTRTRFLTELFNLQQKCRINVFATSRFIPEITERFKGSISLEISASSEDVWRYLDGHMFRLPGFVGRSTELQEEIKTQIVESVKGMFLLAQLHLDSLIGKRSAKAVRNALEKLPTGSEAYDQAYEGAMKRIEGQVADQEQLAKQVLSWIICARRILHTSELQHALAVEVGESYLDEENLPQIEDIVSVCAGLVTIDEESDIIRLVHYTTQEYFKRTQTKWFPDAETDMTTTCVTYLSFSTFEAGFCLTDLQFEERLRLNQLYAYAAQYWGYHAREASTLSQQVIDFLEDDGKAEASGQALLAFEPFSGYSQRVPRRTTGLHLGAYFGLEGVVNALLERSHLPDLKDTWDQTPLSLAAEYGREAVIKLLLAKGANGNSKSNSGQTPLSYAAANGNEAAMKLLLASKGIDVNSKSHSGQSPLSYAAANGHVAVVKSLLAIENADVNSKCKLGQTPLSRAAEHGHEAVVKLLLATGIVNVDSKDNWGQTPLLYAAAIGHEAIVKRLLDTGSVDADSKATGKFNAGRTPLSWAAVNGHDVLAKLLLETGKVEVDSRDSDGRTPLSLAASNGHEAVVKLLLDAGKAEADSRDFYGRTPLSFAASNGHEAVAEILLDTGKVNVNSKDTWGNTPLLFSTKGGHKDVVKLLLEKGADARSNCQPLRSWTAGNGRGFVVKLLLDKVSDPE